MPRVSCIIPVFNAAATLEPCLRALKNSQFDDFEIIVVNDASTDDSARIARSLGVTVVDNPTNLGPRRARKIGSARAQSEIHVFIDSDIIVKPDSLALIEDFFATHPDYDAVTGMLSCDRTDSGFSTDYKNLYMHYIFRNLPSDVTFVYGSIFALRAKAYGESRDLTELQNAEDTALGQNLFKNGKKLRLLKTVQVLHLKQYTLRSLLANDFWVPFDWALIFLRNRAWNQFGRHGTGFAHASKRQIGSIFAATILLFYSILLLCMGGRGTALIVLLAAFSWAAGNFGFFRFLLVERGAGFAVKAALFTMFDQVMMVMGIVWGTLKFCGAKCRECDATREENR